ncbi:D-Ala-D-Ala dipeptidase [Comamonas aquatica]|jgi:D-alanyl-D-alanine dipeptidase|uniref:D-Ala-D-Ala dipeptidase n=2 Tax=Comamonas aquatica TaxID=225991 RepID=UPI0024474851|nr:D-Ala-D-Ala dipeptidase [Comamonas aquatica]MDH0381544.1 D-Ala-D-Ala dipeptidase [Comamonas aquatica]MDH0429473.1 D-Ala-D-Ala dipeptidase [Comamonas aquatica]MDH0899899.1 D-Ala-D-Ala dipeptidase [Comamonas aquatica]MDH0939917.1 D-Ala-D-Ala dipeptidase [Comamonas aquatica]MDH1814070.1 D-Ala-D-Ala dipeptidase [Comamonas aquatica]
MAYAVGMNFFASKCFSRPTAVGGLLLVACLAAAQARVPDDADVQTVETDCQALLAQAQVRRALQLVRVQLLAQGLQLRTNGCPFVRTGPGQMQQVLDVAVRVVDSDVAGAVVRGPLADGEDVDMGGIQLGGMPAVVEVGGLPAEEDVSPDVLFNRAWLAAVMRARGFQPLPGAWWGFLPGRQTQGL